MSKSFRLNVGIRDNINQAVIRHGYADRANALFKRELDFYLRSCLQIIGNDFEKINSLPAKWFSPAPMIAFYSDDATNRICHFARHTPTISASQNYSRHIKFSGERKVTDDFAESVGISRSALQQYVDNNYPMPQNKINTAKYLLSEKDHPEIFEFCELLDDDYKSIKADISADRAQIAAVLEGITTPNKLYEKWPEIEPIARPIIESSRGFCKAPNSKALVSAGLNTRLRLPPETEAA